MQEVARLHGGAGRHVGVQGGQHEDWRGGAGRCAGCREGSMRAGSAA